MKILIIFSILYSVLSCKKNDADKTKYITKDKENVINLNLSNIPYKKFENVTFLTRIDQLPNDDIIEINPIELKFSCSSLEYKKCENILEPHICVFSHSIEGKISILSMTEDLCTSKSIMLESVCNSSLLFEISHYDCYSDESNTDKKNTACGKILNMKTSCIKEIPF